MSLKRRVEEEEVVGREPWSGHCMGKEALLPTMIREDDGEREDNIPEWLAMCNKTPVSKTKLVELGGEGHNDRMMSTRYRAGDSVSAGACWAFSNYCGTA